MGLHLFLFSRNFCSQLSSFSRSLSERFGRRLKCLIGCRRHDHSFSNVRGFRQRVSMFLKFHSFCSFWVRPLVVAPPSPFHPARADERGSFFPGLNSLRILHQSQNRNLTPASMGPIAPRSFPMMSAQKEPTEYGCCVVSFAFPSPALYHQFVAAFRCRAASRH
jgi:hypothetical protein